MDDDAGVENQPSSLVDISSTSQSADGAGPTSLDSIPIPEPSPSLSPDSASEWHNSPDPSSSDAQIPENPSSEATVATQNSDLQLSDEPVQIEILKTEDDLIDTTLTPESAELLAEGLSAEDAASQGDDAPEWGPETDHEMKRVKVYELVASRWVDQGTAYCFGHFSQDGSEALLTARSEKNFQDIILTTTIRSNDVYQRQQDTLIVWTEPDGVDYALSFQDPDGCAEVWNFILEVQRHLNGQDESHTIALDSPLIGPEAPSITTQTVIRSGHLPAPQMGIIADIEKAIKGLVRSQAVKDRICEYIQQEDYIKQMIDVMQMAEDMESLETLHALCSLMQTILMLNDHSMYEHIVDDELFLGVIGMLEYDPEFPSHKANYRDFLRQTSQFHQPIPVRDPSIQRRIHHTYRLQFLKDVVLARALDDSTFTILNACIIYNQTDIITHIQQDPTFLREIVRLYVDEDMLGGGRRLQQQQNQAEGAGKENDANSSAASKRVPSYAFAPPDDLSEADIALRREVILLVQQLCAMGRNVQLQARMNLFRTLVDRGILFAVQWALSLPEKEEKNLVMINAGGEILTALLDHDLNGVRGHVTKQELAIEKEREAKKKGADKAETVIRAICRILAKSKVLGVQSQVGEALKSWLDLPLSNDTGAAASGSEAGHALIGAPKLPSRKDDPGTERFMNYFYKDCIDALFAPILELPEWQSVKDPVFPLVREETNRFTILCDLLYNFTLQHSFRSNLFILSNNIATRVATLLKSKDKHLRHASFRFFRLLLKLNNPNIHTHVMKTDVIKPVLDLAIKESRRDNLVSCSCQEYFEHMRRENMKDMINHCMTKYEVEIRQLAETPLGKERFKLFIQKWEINNEPPPVEEAKADSSVDHRWPSQGRTFDAEEEDYFNGDDDDDNFVPAISQQFGYRGGMNSPLALATYSLKRKRRSGVTGHVQSVKPKSMAPLLGQLVDYEEDDKESPPAGIWPPIPESVSQPSSSVVNESPSNLSSHTKTEQPASSDVGSTADSDTSPEELTSTGQQSGGTDASSQPFTPSPRVQLRPKRARVDDDDDELLERLTRSKKQDLGNQKEAGGQSNHGRSKIGDDPPKKFKLKIGKTLASSVTTSEDTAKDGDTG